MPRTRKRSDNRNTRQVSLFDLIRQAQEATARPTDEGRLDVGERLRAALREALRRCPLSRWEVAGRMSLLVGREVSKHMLDAYTAETKEAHRFPAEWLPAFCEVTGSTEPLRLLAEAAGMFALPGPEALRAEVQRLREQEARIRAERRKREAFLREMEGAGGRR